MFLFRESVHKAMNSVLYEFLTKIDYKSKILSREA